jgi:dihydroorotate dehydrogenase (NAD+) catalytic subunit
MEQAYNIHESYAWNYERGPSFHSSASSPSENQGPEKFFLGKHVRSRIGIAAGLLLNSRWVLGYARRGYDILTYKTVRSSARPSYPPPNWVFVRETENPDGPVIAVDNPPCEPAQISSAVCFGMPSMAPEIWREDIRRTRNALSPDQMLIVSVVATPRDGWSLREVSADFRRCAMWAAEAGADAVEANFSCPNVCSAEGTIYLDPDATAAIAGDLRQALGKTPLLIKSGQFPDRNKLRDFLRAVNGKADGVVMVNCITRPVLHADGRPVFGSEFVKAGVIGRAIHRPSVEAVREAVRISSEEKLSLSIVAVGGASRVADVADFFEAGAAAVLMGSSPMYLPGLAAEAKQRHPDW